MNIKTFPLLPFLIMAMLVSSCSNKKEESRTAETDDKPLSIKIQVPTVINAVKHIKSHIDRTIQKVMVQTPYYEMERKKKPCDQYDQNCSGIGPGAPYGYHMVSERVRKCCKPKEKSVYMIRGNWVATYLEPKNEWSVTLEYKDDAKDEQQLNWSISLNQSNGLQVSVE